MDRQAFHGLPPEPGHLGANPENSLNTPKNTARGCTQDNTYKWTVHVQLPLPEAGRPDQTELWNNQQGSRDSKQPKHADTNADTRSGYMQQECPQQTETEPMRSSAASPEPGQQRIASISTPKQPTANQPMLHSPTGLGRLSKASTAFLQATSLSIAADGATGDKEVLTQHRILSSCSSAATTPKTGSLTKPNYLPLRTRRQHTTSVSQVTQGNNAALCLFDHGCSNTFYQHLLEACVLYSNASMLLMALQYCSKPKGGTNCNQRQQDDNQLKACTASTRMQLTPTKDADLRSSSNKLAVARSPWHYVKIARARHDKRSTQMAAGRAQRMHCYSMRFKDTAILEYERVVIRLQLTPTNTEEEPLRVDLTAADFKTSEGHVNVQIMTCSDPKRPISLQLYTSPYKIYTFHSDLECSLPQYQTQTEVKGHNRRSYWQIPQDTNPPSNTTYKQLLQMALHQNRVVACCQEPCHAAPKTVWVYCPTHLLVMPRLEDRLIPSWVNNTFSIIQDPVDTHLYAAVPAGQGLMPANKLRVTPEQWAWLPADYFLEHFGISALASSHERKLYVKRLPKAARHALRPLEPARALPSDAMTLLRQHTYARRSLPAQIGQQIGDAYGKEGAERAEQQEQQHKISGKGPVQKPGVIGSTEHTMAVLRPVPPLLPSMQGGGKIPRTTQKRCSKAPYTVKRRPKPEHGSRRIDDMLGAAVPGLALGSTSTKASTKQNPPAPHAHQPEHVARPLHTSRYDRQYHVNPLFEPDGERQDAIMSENEDEEAMMIDSEEEDVIMIDHEEPSGTCDETLMRNRGHLDAQPQVPSSNTL